MDKKSITLYIICLVILGIGHYWAGGFMLLIAYSIGMALWLLCVYFFYYKPIETELQKRGNELAGIKRVIDNEIKEITK